MISTIYPRTIADANAYGYSGEGDLSIAFGPEANALVFVSVADRSEAIFLVFLLA
jgi:hypothetical protein